MTWMARHLTESLTVANPFPDFLVSDAEIFRLRLQLRRLNQEKIVRVSSLVITGWSRWHCAKLTWIQLNIPLQMIAEGGEIVLTCSFSAMQNWLTSRKTIQMATVYVAAAGSFWRWYLSKPMDATGALSGSPKTNLMFLPSRPVYYGWHWGCIYCTSHSSSVHWVLRTTEHLIGSSTGNSGWH